MWPSPGQIWLVDAWASPPAAWTPPQPPDASPPPSSFRAAAGNAAAGAEAVGERRMHYGQIYGAGTTLRPADNARARPPAFADIGDDDASIGCGWDATLFSMSNLGVLGPPDI